MRNLFDFVPSYYDGVQEIEKIIEAETVLFTELEQEKVDFIDNQFLLTLNIEGIKYYEKMLKLMPDVSDTLEQRRLRILNRFTTMPPFTIRFLKDKLDDLIGQNNWDCYIDYGNMTIYVESSATSQSWYNELLITMVSIKPANMIFINKPVVPNTIEVSEQIEYATLQYNYRLGVSWILGRKPFVTYLEGGIAKLMSTPSIKPEYLESIATHASSEVVKAVINDTVEITTLTKTIVDNVAIISYEVTEAQATEITNIKLYDSLDVLLA